MWSDKQNSRGSRPLLNIPGSVKKKESLEDKTRKMKQRKIEAEQRIEKKEEVEQKIEVEQRVEEKQEVEKKIEIEQRIEEKQEVKQKIEAEQKTEVPIVQDEQVSKLIGNRDPLCKELVPLNVNGLKDRLNFRLLKNIGNRIEVTIRCDENDEKVIVGKIQEVGTDFIGVLQEPKVIVTILWENIREIRFKDGDVIVIDQPEAEEVI